MLLDGRHSALKIILKNSGNTQAKNVRIRIGMMVEGFKDVGPDELPPLVVAAHDSQTMTFPDLIQVFERAVISDIFKGDRTFRFQGEVTYEDIFHKAYTLKCAGRYYRGKFILE